AELHRFVDRDIERNDAPGNLVETCKYGSWIGDALRRRLDHDRVARLRRRVRRLWGGSRRTWSWRPRGWRLDWGDGRALPGLALVRRRSLAGPDLAEVAAQRLRRAVAAAAASVRFPARAGSMAAGSLAPAAAAMAECRGRSSNTAAAVAGMTADRAHRLAGV